MQSPNIVQNYCQLDPLREVWIGGCYPPEFFDHLDAKTRDIFHYISEITQKDFDALTSLFESLGVSVRKPAFTAIDDFLDEEDRLLKPPITPCDFALVIDDTLFVIPQYPSGVEPYQHALDDYVANQQKVEILDRSIPDPLCHLVFASFVSIGKDIYVDFNPDGEVNAYADQIVNFLSQTHRVHVSRTGNHYDATFFPAKHGHIITSHYKKKFVETFPGWKVFHIKPEPKLGYDTERKWHIPGIDYLHFNQEIMNIAHDWIGYSPETVFEVNMVCVDEKNVICCAEHDEMFRYFEHIGITAHVAKFQSKAFWDAGMHCLTRDIHRLPTIYDHWPGRGDNGKYHIREWNQ